jgi:hypothetical protein
MMFRRLASAEVDLPSWDSQLEVARKLKWVAALRRSVGEQLNAITALHEALLRWAFSGAL